MAKSDAIQEAEKFLDTLINKQSNLFQYTSNVGPTGANAANFAIQFIETYAAWIEKKEK
jgi:hypothetical protein